MDAAGASADAGGARSLWYWGQRLPNALVGLDQNFGSTTNRGVASIVVVAPLCQRGEAVDMIASMRRVVTRRVSFLFELASPLTSGPPVATDAEAA